MVDKQGWRSMGADVLPVDVEMSNYHLDLDAAMSLS